MTPKDKAKQIVDDMEANLLELEDAKECAQIAAFEVLQALKKVKTNTGLADSLMFWYNVHSEIIKL